MTESAYLRPADAARFIGVGLSTLWRYLANRDKTGFPQPKKVSERVTVFKRADLEAWVESRDLSA
ncbi:helix-turn-helix transcriptional regulator [Thauera mechernichensis]|uniref:Helix-turn-helix transcriptional regulator n=1 Tax=Thauera mechernichensis TaxID=82788 RepID=A0ABW3WHZ1_9RHOO|nr:helix-turn-helix domain-containing protein [Thauera mechernichensis]MDG3066794.1 helix-turn-helix domain-containing protein [Thauera mechernichensis]